MPRPKIFESFDLLNSEEAGQEAEQKTPHIERNPNDLSLRKYIEAYAVSLPAIVRSFPRGNLDMRALEAHYWDRLKKYYPYDDFKAVRIESKEEIEFINTAIKMIEGWFYKGQWTSCLAQPSEAEIKEALEGRQNNFLQKVRANKQIPNLGRDRKGVRLPPMPDIYEDAQFSKDLPQVYREHAFKFFHSPAAVMNTLTKVETVRKVEVNDAAFLNLITSAQNHAESKLAEWSKSHKGNAVTSNDAEILRQSGRVMKMEPGYIRHNPRNKFKRELFFMKTCMAGAELMRRSNTENGELTLDNFEGIMDLLKQEMARAKEEGRDPNYLPMDFAGGDGKEKPYSQSSSLHVNTKELPIALMAVDYLRQKNMAVKR